MEKIVAIVVTYNRKGLLKECLDAILGQSFSVNKLIVIDNNSNDGTGQMLKEEYSGNGVVTVIRMKKNVGGAGGFYIGIIQAMKESCDYIWLMDDDTIVKNNCLEELVNAKRYVEEKQETPAFFASAVYGANGEYMNVPVISSKISDSGFGYWYKYLDQGVVNIEMATFVSIMINSEGVKKCGLPCRDFFIWGDDSEYTLRLSRFFGDAYLVGKSVAIHKRKTVKELDIREETDDTRIEMYRYKYRNRTVMEAYYWKDIHPLWELIKEAMRCVQLLKSEGGMKKAKIILSGRLEGIIRYAHFKRYIDGQLKGV